MHIAILGNGISGITAARHIRKNSDHEITVISAESEYFFSRTALMYIYMGHLRFEDTQPYETWFWEKNGIHLKQAFITEIDFDNKVMVASDSENIPYDKLIIAVGSKSNEFGWPGQDLDGVQGLYSLQDLQMMERATPRIQRAVIVGGGLIGVEMAEMFRSRNIPVTMLVREDNFWDIVLPIEEAKMLNTHIRSHGVELQLSTELDEISGDDHGKVKSVLTKSGQEINCEFVGLTVGVSPNIDMFRNTSLKTNKGILVNNHLETSVEGVYAIGDCAEIRDPRPGRRSIEAVWYTGRMMGEVVAHNICGNAVEYDPGIWFNSAKFFDIEYQVYGYVPQKSVDGITSALWLHPELAKSVRLVWDTDSKQILGFNLLGIRFRHEVCEKWIQEKTPIDQVLRHIKMAFFDPSFYDSYEHDITKEISKSISDIVRPESLRYNDVHTFLKSSR